LAYQARKEGLLKLSTKAEAGAALKAVSNAGRIEAARIGMIGAFSGMFIGALLGSNEPKNRIRGLYR
jgi:hypothetical protein